MKPKGLLIAVVLLAVLGGAVWYSNKQEAAKAGKTDTTTTKVLSIPEDQFQEIRIQKVTGEVERLSRDTGKWRLVEPKPLAADQDAVLSLVNALASLNADQVVEEKAEDLKGFGLTDPTLRVQIKRKDGKTDELLVGDDAPTGSGSFAKLPNDPRVFMIATFTKSSIDKRPDDLRDKRLVAFDQDKLTRVELAAKGQVVEFGKDAQGEWQIVKPRPMRADSSAVNGLVDKLRDAKMDVTATQDAAKGFAGGTRVAVATVQDVSGAHTIEVRKDKDKNYFAKGSAVDGFYKIASDVGDALDKGLDDFRNKKLFDFGFSDPSRVDVKGASYTKSGDKWMSGPKAMDNGSVQTLIDKLRDLSASKFAGVAGGEPAFEASVTSNNGKRVEKVTIRKLGNSYFAQRDGEPSIYEVDSAAVEGVQKAAADVKEAAPAPPADSSKKK